MVFSFSAIRLHQVAGQIAGKSQAEARTLLLQQAGIVNAQFSATSSLPDNVDALRTVIKIPPGL